MLEAEYFDDTSSGDLNFVGNFSQNLTSSNVTSGIQEAGTNRHVTYPGQILITFSYAFGISANICALVLLARRETARNRKQSLMVRCLAYNDLVALLGSLILMYMQLYMDKSLVDSRWFCALRVILRTFGLSSGCVAIVMAAERWMALTRPFLYQKVSLLHILIFIHLSPWVPGTFLFLHCKK